MQIVFNLKSCEESRQNKKVTDFFSPFYIYCDPSPEHQDREKENHNET